MNMRRVLPNMEKRLSYSLSEVLTSQPPIKGKPEIGNEAPCRTISHALSPLPDMSAYPGFLLT